MNFPHVMRYPISVKTTADNSFIFSSIDFPICRLPATDFQDGLEAIRGKLEDLVWDLSKDNKKITPPSNIKNLRLKDKNTLYFEVEIKRSYDSLPKFLYYYLPVSVKLFKMLSQPYIWFSNPLTFNDPFELPNVIEKNWTLNEEWRDFELIFNENKDKISKYNQMGSAEEAYLNLKLSSSSILKNILDLKVSAIEGVMRKARVACFSRYYDNVLMWSHYANKHTGVVIGYNYEKITDQNVHFLGSDVNYKKHVSKIRAGDVAGGLDSLLNSDYIQQKLFTKHPSWAYEQEYRLLNQKSTEGEHPISSECISELYYGCNITPSDKMLIQKLIGDMNINLYQLVKSQDNNLICE
jgi:hypothetical protein